MAWLIAYDWVPIPLVYTQVMSLTVRLYFFFALMGHQNIAPTPESSYVDRVSFVFLNDDVYSFKTAFFNI